MTQRSMIHLKREFVTTSEQVEAAFNALVEKDLEREQARLVYDGLFLTHVTEQLNKKGLRWFSIVYYTNTEKSYMRGSVESTGITLYRLTKKGNRWKDLRNIDIPLANWKMLTEPI